MKKFIFVMLFAVCSAAYGSDWAHNAINLTHKFGDGSGVKVGVLDGAVRCSHQELAGRCNNTFYPGGTGYSNHGTHVATIIAGRDKAPSWLEHDGGVAPNAKIYSYEVFGSGDWWISDANEVNMVNRAARDGVSVINMSYGAYDEYGRAALVESLLKVWRSHKNITFVNAAGNDGTVMDPNKHGDLENVIFVGATDQSGNMPWWSNIPGQHYKNQFIVAPGDYISGGFGMSDSDYGHMSGTSMATPMVTGAIAILHDHWGHLKNNPRMTAGIIFDSAIDLGPKGVDPRYGHGMLNIPGMFKPIPIVSPPGNECGNDPTPIVGDPDPIIGTPPPGNWYDDTLGRDERSWYDSKGRKFRNDCGGKPEKPIVILPPSSCGRDNGECPIIGTPGDGNWYDSRGNRNYYAVEVRGERKPLKRATASSVLIKAASKLPVVFFDKYGRDYKTNAVNYKSIDRIASEYMALNDSMSVQMVDNNVVPNFKMKLSDDVAIGKGRTLGLESNPVLNMLEDGAFIVKDKVGVMHSDTSTTLLYKPKDWWTLTYTEEDGFLGSTGMGKYDTIASTWSKDYGMFFGSTTMALSTGGDDRGIVKMSDKVGSLAFEAGLKGEIKKNFTWKLAVSQDLQPVNGSMSVAYDNRSGRTVTRSVDLDDDRTTKIMLTFNFKW